jgi:hypothetical protein
MKSRRMRWTGHEARIGEWRHAYRVLVEEPDVRSPLERTRCRWEDNIKMDFREWDRYGSEYGQVAGCCECGNEPSGSIKCGEFLD